jgi:hypothetical protein
MDGSDLHFHEDPMAVILAYPHDDYACIKSLPELVVVLKKHHVLTEKLLQEVAPQVCVGAEQINDQQRRPHS